MGSREALEYAIEAREAAFESLDNVDRWADNISYFVALVKGGEFDIASTCADSALSSVCAFRRDWKAFRKSVESFFEALGAGVSNG